MGVEFGEDWSKDEGNGDFIPGAGPFKVLVATGHNHSA